MKELHLLLAGGIIGFVLGYVIGRLTGFRRAAALFDDFIGNMKGELAKAQATAKQLERRLTEASAKRLDRYLMEASARHMDRRLMGENSRDHSLASTRPIHPEPAEAMREHNVAREARVPLGYPNIPPIPRSKPSEPATMTRAHAEHRESDHSTIRPWYESPLAVAAQSHGATPSHLREGHSSCEPSRSHGSDSNSSHDSGGYDSGSCSSSSSGD